MNIDIQTMFPRASKSFIEANPPPSVGTGNGIRRGRMNKTEAEYALILESMKRKEEILRYEFEGITLRFAGVKYTPDFVVLNNYHPKASPDTTAGEGAAKHTCKASSALCEVGIGGQPPTTAVADRISDHGITFIEVKGPFCKGKFERAVERFRHAKTYWPEFTFELHQKTKNGWQQLI